MIPDLFQIYGSLDTSGGPGCFVGDFDSEPSTDLVPKGLQLPKFKV